MLLRCQPGTFIVRFTESEPGGVSIVWVKSKCVFCVFVVLCVCCVHVCVCVCVLCACVCMCCVCCCVCVCVVCVYVLCVCVLGLVNGCGLQ